MEQAGPDNGSPARSRWVRITLPDSAGRDVGHNIMQGVEWHRQLFLICQTYSYTQLKEPTLIIYNLDTHQSFVPGNTIVCGFSALTPANDLLLAMDNGIRKVDPETLSHHILRLLPPPAPYSAAKDIGSNFLYFDKDASLWLVASGRIIRIDKDGNNQQFTEASGLPPGPITSLLQDRENNIWFTNEQNGVVKLVNRQVQFYTQLERGFVVTDIYAGGSSDSVWFYDAHKKTLRLMAGNASKTYQGTGPLPEGGRILIGPQSYLLGAKEIYTLHFLSGDKFRASLLFRDTIGIGGNACRDQNGNFILTSNKLTLLANGKVRQYPTQFADEAAVDRYNRLWVVTREPGLAVYRINTSGAGPSLQLLKKFTSELPEINPRSLATDGKGRVWIGTRDHGLYCLFFDDLQLRSFRQLTMANGLSENFVNYLLCDTENTIWACTPTGLDKIRLEEDGHFTIEDITRSNDNYQFVDKVLSSARGVHWAMVRGGFIKIDSSGHGKRSPAPSILFSKVLVGDKPIPDATAGSLTLPYDSNTLSFFIGTPTFVDEGRTLYTFRLEGGREQRWSTPSVQSAINFVNLPPGKYILRVRAQFPTGSYPEQAAAWSFVIRPPWWQTWWFRAALVLVLTSIIMLAIRNYIRRKLEIQRIALEKKQAIEKERTRIATDMHDDLGAGLSRIKFLSETIGIKKQQQLPIEEEITSIREYSHEMIDKMGEIVWALNEKNDSLSDLLSYTRSYAAEYLLQSGIRCTVETPEDFPLLFVSGEFRRNIFLTIKETLHNIVKHAQASCVRMTMDTSHGLTITIQDDGIGFDQGQIRPFSNGLSNMQQRIRDIGGYLLIQPGRDTNAAGGTIVKIIAPL
jgi:signal transduction histidine kinase/streptogramin lyase